MVMCCSDRWTRRPGSNSDLWAWYGIQQRCSVDIRESTRDQQGSIYAMYSVTDFSQRSDTALCFIL